MSIFKKCKVENCENNILAKQYCQKHYKQYWRNGKILERTIRDKNEIIDCGKYYEICLYNNKHKEIGRTKIDKEDLEKIKGYKWCFSEGYVLTIVNKKTTLLHQIILEKSSAKYEVDHKYGDKLDNRKSELRFATHQQNSMNKKVKGYYWNKQNKKWVVYIKINGKKIYLGSFINEKDAIKARKEAELKYFGEYAYNINI